MVPAGIRRDTETVVGNNVYEVKAVFLIVSVAASEIELGPGVILGQVEDHRCTSIPDPAM